MRFGRKGFDMTLMHWVLIVIALVLLSIIAMKLMGELCDAPKALQGFARLVGSGC